MSNREKLRERIFGILYTLFGSLMFIVGLTSGSSKALLGGFAFLIIGSFSWIKLAANSQEFPVARGEETPLAPGDCFSVFQDQLFLHFRVDELQPDSNNP